MTDYTKYSRDIWDYIDELPYMPSRTDRERLFLDESKRKRVKLWDYFFRIKPEDVGRPQQKEILSIRTQLDKDIEEHINRVQEINIRIEELKKVFV